MFFGDQEAQQTSDGVFARAANVQGEPGTQIAPHDPAPLRYQLTLDIDRRVEIQHDVHGPEHQTHLGWAVGINFFVTQPREYWQDFMSCDLFHQYFVYAHTRMYVYIYIYAYIHICIYVYIPPFPSQMVPPPVA